MDDARSRAARIIEFEIEAASSKEEISEKIHFFHVTLKVKS